MLVGFEFCISVSYFHTTKQQQQQPPQQPQQLQPQVQVIHVLESIYMLPIHCTCTWKCSID